MRKGMVYLVGAGPGDPDLLTVRAWRLIKEAEVLLHDSLTTQEIVDLAPMSAEVKNVGKRPREEGGGRVSQKTIHRLFKKYVSAGRSVVRLKGGDPNVFGRGGEEAEFLAKNKISFEIVPGVSSILATPARAGFPLTHREFASSFSVITGHEDPEKRNSALDWEGISRLIQAGGTLLILMGVRRLEENVRALLDHGVPPDTPSAVIEKATYPEEFVLSVPLEDLVEQTRLAEVSPPAVFVIGRVIDLRDTVKDTLIKQKLPSLNAVF